MKNPKKTAWYLGAATIFAISLIVGSWIFMRQLSEPSDAEWNFLTTSAAIAGWEASADPSCGLSADRLVHQLVKDEQAMHLSAARRSDLTKEFTDSAAEPAPLPQGNISSCDQIQSRSELALRLAIDKLSPDELFRLPAVQQ